MPPIADFTPLSPQAQLAVVSLLAVGLIVLNIIAFFRRKPPLDSELVRLSLAIAGLEETLTELKGAVAAQASHASEIEALQQKVRDLEAFRERDMQAQRTYTRETTREIFQKLDDLKNSVNSNFQSVERRIGQLEGKVEVYLEALGKR